jgi:predicted HicB family RNase H-like nuclease
MDKVMSKKYAMIQIDAEVHLLLKEFCQERGYKINGLVETLIKERVASVKQPPRNVLPTSSKI